MKILAIETSCDETAMALVCVTSVNKSGELVEPRFEILAQVIASQIEAHRPFGGVVPSLAKREHLKNLPVVLSKLNEKYNIIDDRQGYCSNVDLIAVTVGPGLEPALWTGINFAKELAEKMHKPLVGVNHLEGHIYSNWLPINKGTSDVLNNRTSDVPKIIFPAIVLIVSGGHTILLRMDSIKKWEKLGETQDDAAGEAFDKVAKMLGLPYPGGPEVERAARSFQCHQYIEVKPQYIDFPRPMLHSKDFNFSFSGLKTAVLYYLRDHQEQLKVKSYQLKVQICASFQTAVIDVLVKKTMRAAEECGARSVLLCGGVASNKALREAFELRIKNHKLGMRFYVPEMQYNTDNAVMIAAAAYRGNHYSTDIAQGNLNI